MFSIYGIPNLDKQKLPPKENPFAKMKKALLSCQFQEFIIKKNCSRNSAFLSFKKHQSQTITSNKKGTDKYLFKRAMKGILPDKVLFNKKRGRQAADLQQRLKYDLPEIKNIIESFKTSEICRQYLDVKRIEAAIPLIEQKNTIARQQTSTILLKGIQYGLFLQKFK